MILFTPCLINGTLKFIKYPKRIPVSLRWLNTWAFQTGFTSSIAFTSTMTLFSIRTSRRSPSSKVIPSYFMGMSTCHKGSQRPFHSVTYCLRGEKINYSFLLKSSYNRCASANDFSRFSFTRITSNLS